MFHYALSDRFTGDYPGDYTSGFSNTKEPIAFVSKKERDAWLEETKLLTATSLTHREARSRADKYSGQPGLDCSKKAIRLCWDEEDYPDWITI